MHPRVWLGISGLLAAFPLAFLALSLQSKQPPRFLEALHMDHVKMEEELSRASSKLKLQQKSITRGESRSHSLVPKAEQEQHTHPIISEKQCSTADRRALASRNTTATEEEWEAMTNCIVQQHMSKIGHFFMHVSKSGGTSMGHYMAKANCFKAANKNFTKDVFYGNWNAHQLGLTCNWYRKNHRRLKQLTFTDGFQLQSTWKLNPQNTNCNMLTALMRDQKRVAMMSEAMIPFHGPEDSEPLCPNMVNSIMFREPLQRLESHYGHMWQLCKGNKALYCAPAFYTSLKTKTRFNLPNLVNIFDIISDNYYTRSLLGHEWFSWEAPRPYTKQDSIGSESTIGDPRQVSSLSLHPDAYTKLLPMANQSLHAFDWVLVMGSGHPNEADNRNAILQSGMGLNSRQKELPHSRSGKKKAILSDPEMARALNALDYILWQEAQQLNHLDVIAARRMEPYIDKASQKWTTVLKNKSLACCGNVCNNFTKNKLSRNIPKAMA